MGGSKDDMMRRWDDEALARQYLISRGDLEECERGHGVTFGGGSWDLESEFYRSVMADRMRGDTGPIPWAGKMKSREFTDLIKHVMETNCGESCAHCDKQDAE